MKSLVNFGNHKIVATAMVVFSVALLVAATVVATSTRLTATADGELAKNPPRIVDGVLPQATQVPVPDAADAQQLASVRNRLLADPALAQTIDAIESQDAPRLLELFVKSTQTCERRDAPTNCEELTGATAGLYLAITLDAGVFHFVLSEPQAMELLETLLKSRPELSFVTEYTSGESRGDYLVAFDIPEVALGADGARVQLEGAVLSGFGVQVRATADDQQPIIMLAPLSPSYGPLAWAQDKGPSDQRLLGPNTLDDFDRIDRD